MVTLKHIKTAAQLIEKDIFRTPLIFSPQLAKALGLKEACLKLENFQFTGSFKERGALNKILSLNHAQAVAYHGQRLGLAVTVIMPESAPLTKISRCKSFGAEVILHGENIDACFDFAKNLIEERQLSMIHPFDDEHIIAGQGSIGLEIVQDKPDMDVLVVPVGGGGLISGIAVAIKNLNPKIKIIGVVSSAYPELYDLFRDETGSYKPDLNHKRRDTIADGIAVKKPGKITLALIRQYVDDIVIVDETYIEQGVFMLAERQKLIVEGAAGISVGAVMQHEHLFQGLKVGLLICGGNIDVRLLSSIMLRGLMRTGRLARLNVSSMDTPGSLAKISAIIGAQGGNILDIIHQRVFYDSPAKRVDIQFMLELESISNMKAIMAALNAAGFDTMLPDSVELMHDFCEDTSLTKLVS
jgi:threonine dehydratase